MIREVSKVQYSFPETIEEAYRLKTDCGENAHYIAGGTDLLLRLEREQKPPQSFIDLTRIPELQKVRLDGASLIIGSCVTYSRLIDLDPIKNRAPFLASAIRTIGGVQIRNVATLTGNLVNASPAGDALPPLYCLEAQVNLEGPLGKRSLPVSEFILGVRRTALHPGELVSSVSFELPDSDWLSRFDKLGLRRAMAISVANLAILLQVEKKKIVQARIALGAVAPTVIRVPEAEKYLRGCVLDDNSIQEAAQLARAACFPIDDVRASARYRKEAVRGLVRRVLSALKNEIEASE